MNDGDIPALPAPAEEPSAASQLSLKSIIPGTNKVTIEKIQTFLETLCETAIVKRAVEATGLSAQVWYRLRRESQEFADAWEEAHRIGTAAMIDEATRRGKEGWDEPVFYQGEECGTVRKFSDILLMFLIKQRDPSFRESSTVNVNQGGVAGSVSLVTDDPEAASRAYCEMMRASG